MTLIINEKGGFLDDKEILCCFQVDIKNSSPNAMGCGSMHRAWKTDCVVSLGKRPMPMVGYWKGGRLSRFIFRCNNGTKYIGFLYAAGAGNARSGMGMQ